METKEKIKPKLKISIEGNHVIIVECLDKAICNNLSSKNIIRENTIELLEASYLLAKCIATFEDHCGWEAALRLLHSLGDNRTDLFMVYYDLRKRGRIVYRGYRKNTLILRKSSSGRPVEILVLREGGLVRLEDIVEWSRLASGDGMEPVVAIVDGHGNVTYYEARAVKSFV